MTATKKKKYDWEQRASAWIDAAWRRHLKRVARERKTWSGYFVDGNTWVWCRLINGEWIYSRKWNTAKAWEVYQSLGYPDGWDEGVHQIE